MVGAGALRSGGAGCHRGDRMDFGGNPWVTGQAENSHRQAAPNEFRALLCRNRVEGPQGYAAG